MTPTELSDKLAAGPLAMTCTHPEVLEFFHQCLARDKPPLTSLQVCVKAESDGAIWLKFGNLGFSPAPYKLAFMLTNNQLLETQTT